MTHVLLRNGPAIPVSRRESLEQQSADLKLTRRIRKASLHSAFKALSRHKRINRHPDMSSL